MSERKIHCVRCNLYLGVIRDAKLRKTMVHLCDDCNTSYKAVEIAYRHKQDRDAVGNNGMFGDVFGDIFGNGKYKK